MGNSGKLVRPSNIQRGTARAAQALGVVLALFLIQACGSGSTILSGAPVTSASNASVSTNSPASNGTGTSSQTGTSGTGTSAGTGTGTGTDPKTSTNNVTPSYASDPEAALQRIHSTVTLLRGFEKFFGDPFGTQVPTVNKDGDFRYFDCTGLRYCAGSVSQTRTFKTLGSDGTITPGTAYAWYFQNYNTNGAMAIPTITLNGTAYLAFPEGFTVELQNYQRVYQGKATLYIKTKPPEDVIDFEGSINASNLSSQSSAPFNTVGRLEITPNNQPTWTIDFDNWRTYQGAGIEGSKLKVSESGQNAELSVELAGDSETIYALTYQLNNQVVTSRIRKTWEGGTVKFVRL